MKKAGLRQRLRGEGRIKGEEKEIQIGVLTSDLPLRHSELTGQMDLKTP